jgi:hypothetical protein
MDNLQCFVRVIHTKHVADVAEVGDLFIIMRSVQLYGALKHLRYVSTRAFCGMESGKPRPAVLTGNGYCCCSFNRARAFLDVHCL